MKKILSYLNYLVTIGKLSYMSSAMYRTDHILRYVRIILEFSVTILTINIIFSHTRSLGGYTKNEVFLAYSIWLFILCVYYFLTSGSNYQTSRDIRLGDLDVLLIKPLDSQFLATFRMIHIDNLVRIFGSIVVFIYAFRNINLNPTLITYLTFLLQLIGGTIIFSCFNFIAVIMTFATQGGEQMALFDSLMQLGKFPTDIYPRNLAVILWTIIPLVYFGTIPLKTLLNRTSAIDTIVSFVAPVLFLLITRYLWSVSLRHYSSASS